MNPYRHMPGSFTAIAVDRPGWITRLWHRWKYRLCRRGEHRHEFDSVGIQRVFLRCLDCGMVRDLAAYGPVAFKAIGQWRQP